MGRGRRPNLSLEPTRALQTQRAFRQRKAEHLASLEDSVARLTQENAKLRKLLHLPPNQEEGSDSPIRSTEGGGEASCGNCERIQEANRQLALAAAQVETQMTHLQQSIKALRSVLVLHNIPIPSPLSSTGLTGAGEEGYRNSKRPRYNVDFLGQSQLPPLSDSPSAAGVSGIQMTTNYFAASPSQQEYASSSRKPLHSMAGVGGGGQIWHTSSPSNVLSAPTPPSASFSPRNIQLNHNPHPQFEDNYYNKTTRAPPVRQSSASSGGSGSRQLPPPSPMRQTSHLAPFGSAAGGVGSPAAMTRHPAPLPGLSPHSYHSSSSSYPSVSSSGHSAAGRRVQDHPQDPQFQHQQQSYAERYQRIAPSPSAPSPSYPSSPYNHQQQQIASPRQTIASNYTNSHRGRTAVIQQDSQIKTSCCPPKSSGCFDPKQDEKENPPPLGVSFDMRMDNQNDPNDKAEGGKVENAKEKSQPERELEEEEEEDCCFGLVNCDAQGRIVI